MVLSAAGISLPLVPSPMGPRVSKDDERTEPLAWALNLGATGSIPLTESLRAWRPIAGPEVAIYPMEDDDDRSALAAAWRELSGQELGDDPWVISFGFLSRRLAVPRSVLLELAVELARLRAEAPKPPGPWLFRANPQWHEPAPGEDAALRPLEQIAARTDASGRPTILRALERHGIFADAWWDERAAWLDRWALPTLAEYARAARDMHRYLRSDERRRHVEEAGPQPILGAPVSIDWFRHPSVPKGYERYDWLGACERALRDAPSTEGAQGEVFIQVGNTWCRIGWRRDDGQTPAIVETSLE
jgi:hypothetical protein